MRRLADDDGDDACLRLLTSRLILVSGLDDAVIWSDDGSLQKSHLLTIFFGFIPLIGTLCAWAAPAG